jgi:ABC-2 type transport system permease protein
VTSPLLAIYYLVAVGIIFSCIGMMVGLWADRFDHFNVIQTFLITPLIYLGGVFYTVDALPDQLEPFARWNPMLYMVNGLRYAMTGYSDANLWLNAGVVSALAVVSVFACVLLFRSGYKLRT